MFPQKAFYISFFHKFIKLFACAYSVAKLRIFTSISATSPSQIPLAVISPKMPSIEIISLNSDNSFYQEENYKFAIQVENEKIESHRSLFYDFLINLNGTIIHNGNPEFKISQNEGFFAGKLIDWESEVKNDFKFTKEFEVDFKNLIKLVQNNSTIKTVYFLTDYQFSKRKPKIIENLTLEYFLKLYDEKGLEFNRIYQIKN